MSALSFPADVDLDDFLRRYWQRKPLLMRNALQPDACHLQPEELAGLACEPQVEARLILASGGSHPWEVRYGPFDATEFPALPETCWTLLVQDVDKHVPQIGSLLERFRFLPEWRIDDIMVSYAVDGGSVGPHVDDYDVFLIQARGRRRWQIRSQPVLEDTFIPDLELRILPSFEPDQEWVLEPGDILYLPPRVAHWGVALGDCMTCSVGFRAPSQRDLATAWMEELVETQASDQRYRDVEPSVPEAGAEIRPEVIAQIATMLNQVYRYDRSHLSRWFGRYITEPKENLMVFAREQQLDPPGFLARYQAQALLLRHSYSRFAFSHGDRQTDWLFVAGEEHALASDQGSFLRVITQARELHFGYLADWLDNPECLRLLCDLYNEGHFLFPDE